MRARPPTGFASSWVATFEGGRLDGTRVGFAIVDAADGSFLGIAAAVRIDEVTEEAELTYLLGAEGRRRGAAIEALTLLTEWGFAHGLHRLEFRLCADDEASQRVAESCGYVREGLLRSAHFSEGRRGDVIVYARLASDE